VGRERGRARNREVERGVSIKNESNRMSEDQQFSPGDGENRHDSEASTNVAATINSSEAQHLRSILDWYDLVVEPAPIDPATESLLLTGSFHGTLMGNYPSIKCGDGENQKRMLLPHAGAIIVLRNIIARAIPSDVCTLARFIDGPLEGCVIKVKGRPTMMRFVSDPRPEWHDDWEWCVYTGGFKSWKRMDDGSFAYSCLKPSNIFLPNLHRDYRHFDAVPEAEIVEV